MKITGILLLLVSVLMLVGVVMRSGDGEAYAVPVVFALLGIGAIAQAKAKK